MAEKYGIAFYYDDFRQGWQEGIDKAIEMELYRQPYCGCIYSEQERYDNRLKKKLRKERRQELNTAPL
jgi:predicted adenine nucleotide alpha hydrolase (AANH) superfamily ATPase